MIFITIHLKSGIAINTSASSELCEATLPSLGIALQAVLDHHGKKAEDVKRVVIDTLDPEGEGD